MRIAGQVDDAVPILQTWCENPIQDKLLQLTFIQNMYVEGGGRKITIENDIAWPLALVCHFL